MNQLLDSQGSPISISSVAEWESRKSAIQAALQEVMGPLPGESKRCPLNTIILDQQDCGSYIRRLISYASEPGCQTPAYLLIPKSALAASQLCRGVLCLHPTDNVLGHKVVVGLGGKPNRNYATELAKLGFVALAPAYPLLADYQPDLESLGYQSGTMKAVWDNIRAIDLLESLPFVAPGPIGAIGHSLGGHNAIYTAAFEPRIGAVVSSCGFDSYLDYKDGDISGWTSSRYMPRLSRYPVLDDIPFDFHDLIALIAPRPCFVSAPVHDTNFKWESVNSIVDASRTVYELYNVRDSLTVDHPDCGHDFPGKTRRNSYEVLRLVGPQVANPHKAPYDVAGLLVLLAALLFYFQFTTMDKFSVLSPAGRFVLDLHSINHILNATGLNSTDAVFAGLILLGFCLLVSLEIWRGRVTLFLASIFKSERLTQISLIILSFISVRFYLARGVINWAGDASSHMCYAWIASNAIGSGELPIWTNYLATGSPYLQFYGFLFFYMVGFLDLIVRNLDITIKLLMAVAHIASGFTMYLFVRRLCGDRRSAFLAGFAYVICLWHTQQTLIMGRLPLSLFYTLLPLPFYAFEHLRFRISPAPYVILGALTLGLLAFTHPGYAFWATTALALYIGLRILTARTRVLRSSLVFRALFLWLLGILFGAYLTLPMWIERAFVDLQEITHAAVPDPSWDHLFVWSNYRLQFYDYYQGNDNWYGGYLGLSLVGVVLIGLLIGISRKILRPQILVTCLGLFCSLTLVLGYRLPGIRDVDLVKAFNAGRYLLFVVFFLAASVGVGMAVLRRRYRNRSQQVFTWGLLVVLLDLGPTTFQHPYSVANRDFLVVTPKIRKEFNKDLGVVPRGQLPEVRISYPMHNIFYLLGIAWYTVHVGVPSFLTGYREGPQAMSKMAYPLQHLVDDEFKNQNLAITGRVADSAGIDPVYHGIFLMNVGTTYQIERESDKLLRLEWPERSPVIVAPEAAPWVKAEDLDDQQSLIRLLEEMVINPSKKSAERLFLRDISRAERLGSSPDVEILAHNVWNQRVELRVRLSEPCFVRLAYAHYPYLGVNVDRSPVVPLETVEGYIALKMDSGTHFIELVPYLSPLRMALLLLDIALLICGAFVLRRSWRKSLV